MSGTAQDSSCNKNGRLESIDVTKGFIITAVVFLHFIIIVPTTEERVGGSSLPLQALYTGLMLFFIYAGYFYRPGRSAVAQIKKRLITIGTVVVAGLCILPVLMYIYTTVLGMGAEPMDILECYRSLFGNWRLFQPISPGTYIDFPIIAIHNGYYFLQIMLVSFVMFYPIAERVINDNRLVAVSMILLITGTFILAEFVGVELPLYAQLAPIATAFMLFGAVLGKHKVIDRIENGELTQKWNLASVAVAVVAGTLLLVFFEPGVSFDDTVFGDYGGYSAYPYFAICCCFCYLFLTLGVLISRIPGLRRMLAALGRHTLGILCLHIFTLKLLIAPGYGLVRGYAFPDFALTDKLIIGTIALILMGLFLEYAVPLAESKVRTLICRQE